MSDRDVQSVRTHDLLEIDAKRFLSCQTSAPEWVVESLQRVGRISVVLGGREVALASSLQPASKSLNSKATWTL
jgi:hypothetical protein